MTTPVYIRNHGPHPITVSNRDRDAEGKFTPLSDPREIKADQSFQSYVHSTRDLVVETDGAYVTAINIGNENVEARVQRRNAQGELEGADYFYLTPGDTTESFNNGSQLALFKDDKFTIEEDKPPVARG